MSVDLPTGAVIEYPYLWRLQHEPGESEGRKTRPVCVMISVRGRDGFTHLALLAISSRPPGGNQTALEVPEIECRRAGLSEWKRAWITISEYNYDIAERSYYFDGNQPPLGRFSKPFLMRLAAAFAPLVQEGQARVDRSE